MFAFENFTRLMNGFGILVLEVSFCVILILLVRRLFGRFLGARTCRLLWAVLIIRCLIPWSLPVPYHPTGVFHEIATTFESDSPPVLPPPEKKIIVSPELSLEPDTSPEFSVNQFSFSSDVLRIMLVGIWGGGVFILLGLAFYRNRRIIYIATDSPIPVPAWVQEIFLKCRNNLHIKTWPVLIISSNTAAPCLVGALRPRILLPQKLVENTTPEQMRHVILHELTHLKQGDIWFSWLWTLILALHWFNPLLWFAGRYMYFDCETACDERVLGILEPQRRTEYGYSLIELLKNLSVPLARRPGFSCIVERKTNLERRLTMIKSYQKRPNRRMFTGIITVMILLAISLTGFAASSKATTLTREKAELMGRVEHFFLHNFRDITARKSIEWGEAKIDKKDSRSIRYMYEALIWDKEWKIMNQIFTFDTNGKFVNYKNVSGYPKNKEVSKIDTSTKEGMIALVEKFFSRNWRDVTARKIIEWGEVRTDKEGNRSIRCKLEATIWDKEKKIMNKIFTFTPAGEFVSVKDAPASMSGMPALTIPKIKIDSPKDTVSGFTRAAALGNIKTAMAYMLPGGVDYEDIHEILTAQPSSSAKYQFRQLFEAVDPNIPVKIVSVKRQDDRAKVVWLLTFKQTVKFGKGPKEMVFEPGSTFEFDATLKKTEQGWLIDNI